MPKSRALKEEVMPPKLKPKSRRELLKEIHNSGKEDMMYGQETMMRGKIKMMGAKIMMKMKEVD